MPCDGVGPGVTVGGNKVAVGSIPAGVGVFASKVSVDVAWARLGVLADDAPGVGDGVGLSEPASPSTRDGD